jgi:hypothetical protein
MRRMLPDSLRGNFQDIPAWRHSVRELTVTPSEDGPLRAWLHRYATTARSIHWN